MRASVTALLVVFALAGGVQAQEPGRRDAPAPPRDGVRDDRARLLERYRQLPPDERARLRRLYDEHVRGRDPEELEGLRRSLRQRVDRESRQVAEKKRRFEQRPPEERTKYERLMRRLLQELPPEQRREVLQLPPEQRRERIHRLVQARRRQLVDEQLRRLPPQLRDQAQGDLANLDDRQRFKRAREAVEGWVRGELLRIFNDSTLSAVQKTRRINEVLKRAIPEESRREQLRRRILAELERRHGGRGDGGQRPGDPGGAQPGPGGGAPDKPRRRGRGQQ